MKRGRLLLALGALVLIATAIIHAFGASMVSSWLSGERGRFLLALWLLPSVDWVVVALIWLHAAWRPSPPALLLAAIAALIPAAMLAALLTVMGPGFFGVWLLSGATVLALAGAWSIHKARLE